MLLIHIINIRLDGLLMVIFSYKYGFTVWKVFNTTLYFNNIWFTFPTSYMPGASLYDLVKPTLFWRNG